VLKEPADRFTMVNTANGLCKDGRDVQHLQLGAETAMLFLRDRIGDDDPVNSRGIEARNGITAEDAVGEESVDLESAFALKQLGGPGDGVGRVAKVVDKDADAVGNVADEHHAGVARFGELDRTALL